MKNKKSNYWIKNREAIILLAVGIFTIVLILNILLTSINLITK